MSDPGVSRLLPAALLAILLTACGEQPGSAPEGETDEGDTAAQPTGPADDARDAAAGAAGDTRVTGGDPDTCAAGDGGLTLPENFCAGVFAGSIGRARHLAVDGDGDIYVILRQQQAGHGLVALRDSVGDGRADRVERFGDITGTGIGLHDGHLYAGGRTEIRRMQFEGDELVPAGAPETVVSRFPRQNQHAAKSLAFDDAGNLYVNVGAPSNACQDDPRSKGSPGGDPCPQLDRHAGVWRFDADRTGQTQQADGERFASGIRNAVALSWNSVEGGLYAVQHGRDQLHSLWPELFTEAENAALPAEEFFRLELGNDFGWPYCYFDQRQDKKVLAPEYGGDGKEVGRCSRCERPILAFPGHWGPNDLLFHSGESLPDRYAGGAFIAFHGSWNRAPLPQAGYKVVFAPFAGGKPTGGHEDFATGFAGAEELMSPGHAEHRPTGLAEGPDGALYIADSIEGRIWRVIYAPDDSG